MSEFNDILHSIREIANGHEEPYKDGSWETFLKTKRKRKRIPVWPFIVSGLAASIIIGFFVTVPMVDYNDKNDKIPNRSSDIEFSEITPRADTATMDKKKNTGPGQIEDGKSRNEGNTMYSLAQDKRNKNQKETGKLKNKIAVIRENGSGKQALEEDVPTMASSTDTMIKTDRHREITKSLFDRPELRSPDKDKGRRLHLGFSVSPLFVSNGSGDNLGLSVGVQTDIPLSGSLAINSGLTFAHQTIDNTYAGRTSFNEPVSLTSRVFSFDIPLNLKITLKKEKSRESYLLAGISSVGYLSERNTFTYEYEEVIEVTTTSGGQETTTYETVVTETNVEDNEPAFSTFDFAGFVNISYGLKSQFLKNTRLTVEPYLKLPLSGTTSNNLVYTTGGVKLIISK